MARALSGAGSHRSGMSNLIHMRQGVFFVLVFIKDLQFGERCVTRAILWAKVYGKTYIMYDRKTRCANIVTQHTRTVNKMACES